MNTATAVATAAPPSSSLVAKMAGKFGVEPNKMLSTLKATAFQQSGNKEVSNEQMMALLVVADQYGLNPWVKELYAFPDSKGGIVPIVSVDGYFRILNNQQTFNGLHCSDGPADKNGLPEWIECTIYRRDREHPTVIREYMAECRRTSPAWGSHPRRMLRHRAIMQCARIAFGFTGIYSHDEAEQIIEGEATTVPETSAAIDSINKQVAPPQTVDGTSSDEFTFADVASEIAAALAAKSVEQLDLAADLIRQVKDDGHRAELVMQVAQARADIAAVAPK